MNSQHVTPAYTQDLTATAGASPITAIANS